MSKFINITSATTTTLAQASDYAVHDNGPSILSRNKRGANTVTISKIVVTNAEAATATVSIWLDGSTDYYMVSGLAMPGRSTFVWDTPLTFNASTQTLKLTNLGSSPSLYVILS
jgi:hypothetical protein